MSTQEKFYNICLCYHSIAGSPGGVLPFVTYIEDFKAQVDFLLQMGYVFKKPSEYCRWEGWPPGERWACIIFDDARDSIVPACEWLHGQGIPYGIAVIARRLGKKNPEGGFLSWNQLQQLVSTLGYAELCYHTYNMHHLTYVVGDEGKLEAAPILEKPCYVPDGIVLYREEGDGRWYWDYSFVDRYTWGFPLLGTDPATGQPITSEVTFALSQNLSLTRLFLFACLHNPPSSGYDCPVRISVDGNPVVEVVVPLKHYETRSQWQEREFVLLELGTTVNLGAGQHTLKFETLQTGNGAFRIYALPQWDETPYKLKTSCTEHDYPAGALWPARPAIILAGPTGSSATDQDYTAYVSQDLSNFRDALGYMGAVWVPHTTGFNENDPQLEVLVLGGTYEDGTRADTWVVFKPDTTFTAEVLRLKYATNVGERYALVVDITMGEKTGIGQYANPVKVVRWQPTWWDWHWEEVELEKPYTFEAGKEYYIRFQTINASPTGLGLIRAYMDQPQPPQCQWVTYTDPETGETYGDWECPPPEAFEHESLYLVNKKDYSDVWPDGTYIAGGDWYYYYEEPYDGPGKPFIELYEASKTTAVMPSICCYPFGACYAAQNGYDLATPLLTVFQNAGIIHGFTIWPVRADQKGVFREPDLRHSDYTLPRFLVYGDVALNVILNNILAYTGALWPDVGHGGVRWQVSVEYDPEGNATARQRPNVLDFVAFDAYFFKPDGTIQPGEINLNDKQFLQERGVRCLLIFSNYDEVIDGPNPDIARAVLGNPTPYIASIKNTVINDNWAGATINIEWVPQDLRENAVAFFSALARELHDAGKLLHMTVPAITGTSYDDPDWVGWCDYSRLIKYVDAMKVMTYTETFASDTDSTPPGPHAPNIFFNQVCSYIKRMVDKVFWSRILVGCNSFGHWWREKDDQPGTYYGDYLTFHEALAMAIQRGGLIVPDVDGEGFWSAWGYSCCFGTPLTVSRAVLRTLNDGFGGIGMWKADDGDLVEHVAATPQTRPILLVCKKANQ